MNWDTDIIRDLFNTRDQDCIRYTLVEGGSNEDRLYWNKEASGLYTVKSAYRWIQSQKGLWSSGDNSSLWKKMWRIKAPPKTLNLLWRAMSGCHPTKVQLQHRHVPVLSTCPICENEDETTLHILVFCPFAQLCWQLFKPTLLSIHCEDFAGWMEQALQICNAKTGAELATLCWAIWKTRNDRVWRNKKACANYVFSSSMQYLLQWKNAQSKSFTPISHYSREGDGASLWVKPQGNTIKISVDAACFVEQSAYGTGMVVRDSAGALIHAFSKLFQGTASPELAEVIAIREALSWLKHKQWSGVVIESDCLVAIQAIRSHIAMVSPFGRVVATCRNILKDLATTSLFFC